MTPYEKILERLSHHDEEMAAITLEMQTLRKSLEDRMPPIPKPFVRRDYVQYDIPRTYQQAMEQNDMLRKELSEVYAHMDEQAQIAKHERERMQSAEKAVQTPPKKSQAAPSVAPYDKPTDVHIRLKVSVETV